METIITSRSIVWLILIMLSASLVPCAPVAAFAVTPSNPLSKSITDAKVIIIARLTKYIPDPQATPPPPNANYIKGGEEHPFYRGLNAFIVVNTLYYQGEYVFQEARMIKGNSPQVLKINLPSIMSNYYDYVRLHVQSGDWLLLLLKPGASGGLSPVDVTVPLIPLGRLNQDIGHEDKTQSVSSQVIQVMLSSLAVSDIRQVNTYLLRDIVDPQVVVGLAPYLDDANIETRSNVLYCMAKNQQVTVIPRIAALEREIEKRGNGTSANTVGTLGDFTTPDAVPYLNPLLFETAYYTRLNTMFSLGKIADQTSAPYLMLALRDPDPQKVIPAGAWGLLHRVVPALKRPMDTSDAFYNHRAAETKVLYDWWNDELNGKHIPNTPEGKKLLNYTLPDVVPVATLNTLLFQPVRTVREETISRLRKQADASSIPYLVLALQDPDTTVAYQAYKVLHQLVPTLGAEQSATAFTANRDAATQPLYAWWNDELLGKHLPKPPVS